MKWNSLKGGRKWQVGSLKTFPPGVQDTFPATVVTLHVLASAGNVLIVNSVMVMYFCFPNLRFLQGGFLGWFKGRYLSPNLKITGLAPLVWIEEILYLALGNSHGLKEKMHGLKVSESCLFHSLDSLRSGSDTWYSVGSIINVYDF